MQAYSTTHGGPVIGAANQGAARDFIEDLFARHHDEIYRYLARMVHDPELAADLTQDTFVKAFRAQRALQDRTKARAWLYQIAHRVALDELRHRRVVRFVPWTGESPGAEPSAEHVFMQTCGSGELQRALDRIPERQRTALLLNELHDLTGLELAGALGISHLAARALLARGRRNLRQALEAERQADAAAAARAASTGVVRPSRLEDRRRAFASSATDASLLPAPGG
jgi:RNA polymerase sigma-70 factor, ECF subfamily